MGLFVLVSITYVQAKTVSNGEVFGDWQYECSARAEGITQCALVQSIIDTGTLETIVRLSVARSTVDASVTASVLLPLGVDLGKGALLRYGDQRILLPFKMCVIEGCLARIVMSAQELQNLARAVDLTVEFYAVGGVAFAQVSASNLGLREAFRELGFIFGE